jgi:hypothetical protein
VILARFRETKISCFLSYVENRFKYKYKQYHIYTHSQNMLPKVELLEETKGRGKEENDT